MVSGCQHAGPPVWNVKLTESPCWLYSKRMTNILSFKLKNIVENMAAILPMVRG
jgi:hypothetical protein